MIRVGAQILTWMTAGFCLVRGLPVLLEGWKYLSGNVRRGRGRAVKTAVLEAS